jgi:hypothetical protein
MASIEDAIIDWSPLTEPDVMSPLAEPDVMSPLTEPDESHYEENSRDDAMATTASTTAATMTVATPVVRGAAYQRRQRAKKSERNGVKVGTTLSQYNQTKKKKRKGGICTPPFARGKRSRTSSRGASRSQAAAKRFAAAARRRQALRSRSQLQPAASWMQTHIRNEGCWL